MEQNVTNEDVKHWDATGYNERFDFIWKHGQGILEVLDPQPGERILDLGCGTGHLAAQITERGSTAVGIDNSPDMIEAARESYPDIEFHCLDATEFHFEEPFDAVFSNAVLHWARPPEAVVARVRDALRPGGRLVAEFGGQGNVRQIVGALVQELLDRGYADARERSPWYYPGIAEYARLLEDQGLEPIMMRLNDRPTLLNGGERGLYGWLHMFSDHFFKGVPEEERQEVISAVTARLQPVLFHDGNWYADYRRLQVVARRPEE